MQAEYSIWLMPEPQRESMLVRMVKDLSASLGGEFFAPHLTIQGDLALSLDDLSALVGSIANRTPVQRWRVREVENSAHFFRCLYLRFDDEPGFAAMQGAVREVTRSTDGISPFPHVSLAYGNAGPDHAQARANLAQIFNTRDIVFDRLAVARSSRHVAIADWQCLELYPLQQPLSLPEP